MVALDVVESNSTHGNTHVVVDKQLKTVNLDRTHYHAWCVQFATSLRGNHLSGYINGSISLDDPIS